MRYEIKKFDHLMGIEGLSEQLLKNHFTLYEGYIANVNKVSESIAKMSGEDKLATPEYAELKRRFGWEWNGMRLHELYFENLMKGGSEPEKNSDLYKKIADEFGFYELWEKDFKSMAAMRGIGWAILYYDMESDRLFNVWINEHDLGHLSGTVPLLIMDVFEHAFMIDYGLKRADYISAFFNSINWKVVQKRFEK